MSCKKVSLRLVALLLVLASGLVLVACGSKAKAPATSQAATDTVATAGAAEDLDVQVGVGVRGDYGNEDSTGVTTAPEETQDAVATEPEETKPAESEETKPTEPEETQPAGTQPEDAFGITFAQYEAMTEAEQEKFVESFPSVSDFVDWWNAAQAQQDKEDTTIIDGDVIDLGDLIP